MACGDCGAGGPLRIATEDGTNGDRLALSCKRCGAPAAPCEGCGMKRASMPRAPCTACAYETPLDGATRAALGLLPLGVMDRADALWLQRQTEGGAALAARLEARLAALCQQWAPSDAAHETGAATSNGMGRSPHTSRRTRGANAHAGNSAGNIATVDPTDDGSAAAAVSTRDDERTRQQDEEQEEEEDEEHGAGTPSPAGFFRARPPVSKRAKRSAASSPLPRAAHAAGSPQSGSGASGGVVATPFPRARLPSRHEDDSNGPQTPADSVRAILTLRDALFRLAEGGGRQASASMPHMQRVFTSKAHLPAALALATTAQQRALLAAVRPALAGAVPRRLLVQEWQRCSRALHLLQWAQGNPAAAAVRLLGARRAALMRLLQPDASCSKLLGSLRAELTALEATAARVHKELTALEEPTGSFSLTEAGPACSHARQRSAVQGRLQRTRQLYALFARLYRQLTLAEGLTPTLNPRTRPEPLERT